MTRIKALAVLSFLLPTAALPMNDTNALLREGLFPLAGGGLSLEIVSEVVSVSLALDGHLSTVRTYRLRNSGKAGMYRLGALCARWTDPCRGIRIDGVEIRFWNRAGRLSVKEGHVELDRFPLAEIKDCEAIADGDVCGHVWAEFPIWLEAGDTRTVAIRFRTSLADSNASFFDDALERLNLYTEQFWKKNGSADFEFRFAIEGARLPKDLFKPLTGSRYAALSVAADGQAAVLWRLPDFDASSFEDGWGVWMVPPPHGMDLCALYRIYRNAGGRYPEWPRDRPVTPCS